MSAPARFGRYRVERRIGSGSFATVWLAHDEVLDAPVAVKVLADNWAHRLDVRERFEEEARILRRADSDRVVRVHDIGELEDGRPYFVMTYADRGTLADRLADGPMPVPVALRHAADVARGLAVLHEVGVIHRDINLANVLLRSGRSGVGDRVLVADLGLAKAAARGSGFTLTVGTPGYMAPEQASGEGISKRTDVYAVGALLWHLLTGAAPVAGEPLPPVSPVDLPAPVGAVLRQALARRPEDRFPSAGALADALDAAAIELARTPTARTPTARTPTTARTKAAPTEPARAEAAPTEPTRAEAAPTEPMPTESSPTGTALDATQLLRRDQVRLAEPDEPGAATPPRGRRRWIAVAAVLVLLATGTTAYLVVRAARQPVAVVARSGLTVEVPASWAKQQQADDWDLTPVGAAGKRGPALLVAGDVARWRDPSSTTPGVFVGVARGVTATSLWAASAASAARGCSHTEQTRTLSSGLTGQVRRYECPGAPTRVTEAVLTRPGATELVFVQVKEPVGDDAAATVLDSVDAPLS